MEVGMKLYAKFICLFVLLYSTVAFADWPQWRGPNRDGVLTHFSSPEVWPKQLRKIWSVEVGGGDSSPIVIGDRVYVHTRQGEHLELVSAIDLDSGRILWQDSYGDVSHSPGWYGAESRDRGPFSTPALRDGVLYTFGVTQTLSAYDAETGNLLWRRNFAKQFGFGTAMSPIVEDGHCIVHVGDNESGALTALDVDTGDVVWQWDEDAPSYSSPIIAELSGTKQIVTVTWKNCIGISPGSGTVLWKYPYEHPWGESIVTPVQYGDTLILSGVTKGVEAVKVDRNGDNWSTQQIWHNEELSMYASSPVLIGDLLYGFSDDGQFFCLDARTGSVLWTSEAWQGEHASIIGAGDVLFCLTGDAELIVAKRSDLGFEPLARYTVGSGATWAHPVILGRQLLVKDTSALTLWSMEYPGPSEVVSVPQSEEPVATPAVQLEIITWERDGAEMVLIPAGAFQMGSNGGDIDERPIHTVYLDAFYIEKYEVSNAQYRKFTSATGHPEPEYWSELEDIPPEHPVSVTWYDAMAYPEWAGKRLPTEAEWEKAARGGLVGRMYPWGDEAPHGNAQFPRRLTPGSAEYLEAISRYRANYDGMRGGVMPVGSFPPNGYGLYDMAGNQWEWCLDEYQADFYASSPKRNPLAGDPLETLLIDYRDVKTARLLRGGLWDVYDNLIRCANRFNRNPTSRGGFRCVASPVR